MTGLWLLESGRGPVSCPRPGPRGERAPLGRPPGRPGPRQRSSAGLLCPSIQRVLFTRCGRDFLAVCYTPSHVSLRIFSLRGLSVSSDYTIRSFVELGTFLSVTCSSILAPFSLSSSSGTPVPGRCDPGCGRAGSIAQNESATRARLHNDRDSVVAARSLGGGGRRGDGVSFRDVQRRLESWRPGPGSPGGAR